MEPLTYKCYGCCYGPNTPTNELKCVECKNDGIVVASAEVNNSITEMQKQKDGIIQERLLSISSYIHLSDTVEWKTIKSSPTEDAYKLWFSKLQNSKLSITEQRNLLQNTITSIEVFNNLIPMIIKSGLLKKLGPEIMVTLTDSLILETYKDYLNNVITNFILYADYGSEINNYSYSEMFNLIFQYVSLTLSKYRQTIYTQVMQQILDLVGYDLNN